jgi:WD40 repeat protein
LFDVNHDGTLAATWIDRQPNRLQLWNPRTGNLVTNLDSSTPLQYAAVSHDNRWLAVSTLDAVTFWTLDNWQARHRIARADAVADRYPLCFSSDNRVLAAVMSNREAWLIDVNSGATLAVLPVDRLIAAIAFSPSGDALAVTCERGWFQLWNLRLLREQLAAMNLDWPAPPLPRLSPGTKPLRVTIDLQASTPPEQTSIEGEEQRSR